MQKYNYKKIRDSVYRLVKEACAAPSNKFGDDTWPYHILPVVEHALALGGKFKADLEVLELSSLLHDYAAIKNKSYYEQHHIHGAKFAGDILKDLGYPEKKIEKVKECILCHRGSTPLGKKSKEAKIIASADAMAHITELADMFFLTYGTHGYKTKEGCKWLRKKLNRSWTKIMPAGRKIVQEDYEIAIKILNKAIQKR